MVAVDANKIMRLQRGLERLASPHRRWVSLAFFNADEVAALRSHVETLEFRRAKPQVSHKDIQVSQDFDICFPAPRTHALGQLASTLEACLHQAVGRMAQPPFPTPLIFNDFAVQRYPAGSSGIGVHRDGARYHHLIVIITLGGAARLFASHDRNAKFKQRIDDRPGRLILLSAPGFAGRDKDDVRPFHGVDQIGSGRLSIGLRYGAS